MQRMATHEGAMTAVRMKRRRFERIGLAEALRQHHWKRLKSAMR